MKFKWGLKPEIHIRKCKYCGNVFIPSFNLKHNISYVAFNYYPIKESINEVKFCSKHFPPSYGVDDMPTGKPCEITLSKEKMANLLKKLVDIIGFVPPSTFHKDYRYLEGLDKERFEEAAKILNDMPPYQKSFYTPYGYKDVFGSWFKALVEAEVLEHDARKTGRGAMCLAEDGHECHSFGEKRIDDWLYRNGIPHEKEFNYPGDRSFWADWKIGDYFIEFWGLKGQEDYDEKIWLKRKIAQEHNIHLIEIFPSDLLNLNSKLKKLKDKYGSKKLPIYEPK